MFLTVLMSHFNFKFEYRCVICIYHIWIQRHLLKKSNLILGWQFFYFIKWGKMRLHTVQCKVEFTTATYLANNYSYPITICSPFQRPNFADMLAHSAVLPYLLPLPLFMEFRGRGGWPEKCRGGWKTVFLINYNESFKHKLIRKQFEVD